MLQENPILCPTVQLEQAKLAQRTQLPCRTRLSALSKAGLSLCWELQDALGAVIAAPLLPVNLRMRSLFPTSAIRLRAPGRAGSGGREAGLGWAGLGVIGRVKWDATCWWSSWQALLMGHAVPQKAGEAVARRHVFIQLLRAGRLMPASHPMHPLQSRSC